MYNGIGLLTPRGSGTSGHVTSNSFNIRSVPTRYDKRDDQPRKQVVRKPDESILEHERKREIELKVVELEDDLETKGCVPVHTLRLCTC
jgi:serine/arginine repetitive matrix protein 2